MAQGAKSKTASKGSIDLVSTATDKVKDVISKSQESVVNAIDQNGNQQIDLEDIIILGLRSPGVKISRSEFLQREFYKHCSQDVIDAAILTSTREAGISSELIDKVSKSIIQYERNCVSGISTALGMPGGAAMVATIPADIIQYYGYLLRATQKILYLYGFQEIDTSEKGSQFDSETMNILILCMGAMYGVAGAGKALRTIASGLGKGVEKKILSTAISKGTVYPIIKKTVKWFNVKLTKTTFANFFGKAIPLVGGAVGGGITYLTFKPCCDRLKDSVKDTILSNPDISNSDVGLIEIES